MGKALLLRSEQLQSSGSHMLQGTGSSALKGPRHAETLVRPVMTRGVTLVWLC